MEVDLTKVKLDPKSIAYMLLGFVVVLAIFGGAVYIYNTIKGTVTSKVSAPTSGFP